VLGGRAGVMTKDYKAIKESNNRWEADLRYRTRKRGGDKRTNSEGSIEKDSGGTVLSC